MTNLHGDKVLLLLFTDSSPTPLGVAMDFSSDMNLQMNPTLNGVTCMHAGRV